MMPFTTPDGRQLQFDRVELERILPLRHAVLWPDRPPDKLTFIGDRHPMTQHFAALAGPPDTPPQRLDVVAAVTYLLSEHDGEAAWHVRGLIVDAAYRHQRIGSALLEYAEHTLAQTHPMIRKLYCNAVASAIGFYEKLGWEAVSEEYLVKGVGTHFKLIRRTG